MTPEILTPEILVPGTTTLAQLEHLYRTEAPARLAPEARPGVEAAAARIAAEHVHHLEAIADLRDLSGLVSDCASNLRSAGLNRAWVSGRNNSF